MNPCEREQFHLDFERALAFTTRLHAAQMRKQSDIPYIAHLISVAGLVLEHGGDRDEAIAALLHDSIEDQGSSYPGGVEALRQRIKAEFGVRVLDIVNGCSDAETIPKPPWQERKERYIAHVQTASSSIRLVSCADKLHNARTIVADLRVLGLTVFKRFNGGRSGTLWYYQTLANEFIRGGPDHLATEFGRAVAAMQELAGRE